MNTNDSSYFRTWSAARIAYYRENPFRTNIRGPENVTCLMYCYWKDDVLLEKFPGFKLALYETWRHFGLLKTIIVTDKKHDVINDFAEHYPNWVEIQIEDQLVPGDINTLSIDCCSRLYSRFKTPYVLTVQDDGFPLRSGIERFIGHYDFIGAPWRRTNMFFQLAGFFIRHWPQNGGFSLRSKKICELVSHYWNRDWKNRPFCAQKQSEDIFYTQTLPNTYLSYRFKVNIASSSVAAMFYYDASDPDNIKVCPIGFHNTLAFCQLMARYNFVR